MLYQNEMKPIKVCTVLCPQVYECIMHEFEYLRLGSIEQWVVHPRVASLNLSMVT